MSLPLFARPNPWSLPPPPPPPPIIANRKHTFVGERPTSMAPPDQPTTTTTTTGSSSKGPRRDLLQEAVAAALVAGPSAAEEGGGNNAEASATFPLGLEKGFESADLRLMEAPPEVLAALAQGQTLRVVGEALDQPAALVTEDATFELCRVETSNMLLLVPPLEPGASMGVAAGNASFHWELKRSKPKQQLLRQLLRESRVWSLEELETHVQGSRSEVMALLRQMNALEVDGEGWRAVDDEKEVSPTLDRLLTELIAAGKSLECVAEDECLQMLSDVEPVLVQYCLKAYGTPLDASKAAMQQDTRQWALDMAKVARFKAHQIFREGMSRPQGEVWVRETFMLEWETRLPGSYRPNETLLQGLALKEVVGGEDCFRYLPAETMPLDPVERLKKLFATRKKWQLDELEHYLLQLVPDKKQLADFLLKNARSSVAVDGQGGRTYSAK